ncbi:ATP-binding cassette transporter [Penicillium malachiteum]|uniref:ATP-binding cassette transporter n=1 Tax=Penicillium malachiteum TaxID=1324776 RepID=A0AAD6HL09_9EURO|nr:ATP-binding cassette transporter [Penicillium malachiteum]
MSKSFLHPKVIQKLHGQNSCKWRYGMVLLRDGREYPTADTFQVFAVGFLIVHFAATWGMWSVVSQFLEVIIVSATIISLIASVGILINTLLEKERRVQPRQALIIYLSLSLVRDLTVFILGSSDLDWGNFQIIKFRACCEGAWLAYHSLVQGRSLDQNARESSSSEEDAAPLSKVFFFWVLPVLKQGYRETLKLHSLPEIHSKLQADALRQKLLDVWTARAEPVNKWTLPSVLLHSFQDTFLSPILSRLALIVFRYAQPIFIGLAIDFVRTSSSGNAFYLLLYATFIYMGLAVSAAIYQHRINQLQIMIRGGMVSLIHHHSLKVPLTSSDGSEPLTLVGSDIESIESTGEILHETWAQLLEVVIGTVMLAARVGWLAFLPLIIIFGCSRMSVYVANNLEGKQKDWNLATQRRIATVTSALSGIKSLKMLGMEEAIQTQISYLRNQELQTSKGMRWILVAYNASANALGIYAPVITLILYATSSHSEGSLQAGEVFSSVALLAMVTHPANMVMTLAPRAVAVMANFARVQSYLIKPLIEDHRQCTVERSTDQFGSFDNVTVKSASASLPIIRNASFDITQGEMLLCVGAVGSGKTTLAMTFLGEATPSSGIIQVPSKKIAYCAQEAWLPTATIRNAISGEAVDLNLEFYNTVVDACGLLPDFTKLPDGDRTMIENNSINLSGGQKQRIALARAIYCQYRFLVLDDPFSALDKDVRDQIIHDLFGPGGLFKRMGTTIFLTSNSTTLHRFADKVVSLKDSMTYIETSFQVGKEDSEDLPTAPLSIGPLHGNSDGAAISKRSNGSNETYRSNDVARDISQRSEDAAVYGLYLNSVGYFNALFMAFCTATYSFALTFSQYILKWAIGAPSKDLQLYMCFYAAISGIAWIATNGTMWSTQIKIEIRSGDVLHGQLLDRILRAPLAYFTENQVGVTLNRFSQDISLIDKQLPSAFANLNTQIFKLLAQVLLILSVQPLITATVPMCLILVYFIQQIYLRKSKQLRLLDLESKSHVYTTLLDTINGASTIRAFGWQKMFQVKFDEALNISQKPTYLLLCLQCWLKVLLDLLIALIAVTLIAFTIGYRDTTTGADIGLALNLIIVANTTLLKLVQSWASLETSLGAVSRLKSVQESLSVEDEGRETSDPDPRWPLSGDTLIENISVSYSSSLDLALQNLSLQTVGGQKVILMGRTGSGKSTLMLSLLKLLTLREGKIEIDSIDIAGISSSAMRRRGIIAVPQDGFNIPTATLRFNLDPYDTCSQEAIIKALKKTRLWDKFRSVLIDESSDEIWEITRMLDLPMSSFLPLSTGQLQLFALCRMLLRVWSEVWTKPVVILDEASSSLDPETESILHDILVEDLSSHTVVMIAHKVDGIFSAMQCGNDKVVTIQDGEAADISNTDCRTRDDNRINTAWIDSTRAIDVSYPLMPLVNL